MPPTLEAVEQHHRSKAATGGGGASRPTSFSGGAPAPLAGRRTQTDPSRPTSFSAGGKKAAGYTPSSASEEKAEASGKGAIVANLQAHKNKMGKEYSEKDDDDVYELVREMLESERPPRAWYIVMPDTRLKMMWDLLILLLVFVSAFSIPAGISYAAIMGPELASAVDAFDWVMVGIFAVDMVLNFAVAFQDRDGAWVRVARHHDGPPW